MYSAAPREVVRLAESAYVPLCLVMVSTLPETGSHAMANMRPQAGIDRMNIALDRH